MIKKINENYLLTLIIIPLFAVLAPKDLVNNIGVFLGSISPNFGHIILLIIFSMTGLFIIIKQRKICKEEREQSKIEKQNESFIFIYGLLLSLFLGGLIQLMLKVPS